MPDTITENMTYCSPDSSRFPIYGAKGNHALRLVHGEWMRSRVSGVLASRRWLEGAVAKGELVAWTLDPAEIASAVRLLDRVVVLAGETSDQEDYPHVVSLSWTDDGTYHVAESGINFADKQPALTYDPQHRTFTVEQAAKKLFFETIAGAAKRVKGPVELSAKAVDPATKIQDLIEAFRSGSEDARRALLDQARTGSSASMDNRTFATRMRLKRGEQR